jgi:hypothetical protein
MSHLLKSAAGVPRETCYNVTNFVTNNPGLIVGSWKRQRRRPSRTDIVIDSDLARDFFGQNRVNIIDFPVQKGC